MGSGAGAVESGTMGGTAGQGSVVSPIPEHEHELRSDFHTSLDRLDDDFVSVALLVAESLPRLTREFIRGNKQSIHDAREMAAAVDDQCLAVEEEAFVLLAREAPVSGDLRRIVALLRLVHDVERSASLLRHVSETLDRFDPRELPPGLQEKVSELGDRATDVFRAGVDAWRRRDGLAINEVEQLDHLVDRLQEVILEESSGLEQEMGAEMLVLGLIARYYERIADHGVALAQDAAFVATGDRVLLKGRQTEAADDA